MHCISRIEIEYLLSKLMWDSTEQPVQCWVVRGLKDYGRQNCQEWDTTIPSEIMNVLTTKREGNPHTHRATPLQSTYCDLKTVLPAFLISPIPKLVYPIHLRSRPYPSRKSGKTIHRAPTISDTARSCSHFHTKENTWFRQPIPQCRFSLLNTPAWTSLVPGSSSISSARTS
jgi:hypothetical protein